MRLCAPAVLVATLIVAACAGRQPQAPPAAPPVPEPTPFPTAPPRTAPPAEAPMPAPTAFLNGTVTFRQRMALTPEAEVQVELQEVGASDADAVLIAKQVIATPGQVPIPFSLEYDPTKVMPGRRYAVSARIVDRGQLLFVTETRVPITTWGATGPLEIVVVPVR